jgi:hypothetical protein
MVRVNTVVDWITKAPNGSADLVMMYFNQPDHDNHAYGPGSVEVTNAIVSMDFFFGQLISKLQNSGALADVDIVLIADHGVSAISPTRTVDLNIPLNLSAYVMGNPVTQIWPKDIRLGASENASSSEFRSWFESIHEPLMHIAQASSGHLSVYARDNIPPHFHYTGPLVAPFVAVSSPGWMVKSLYPGGVGSFANKGAHGYSKHIHSFVSEPLIECSICRFDPVIGNDMHAVLQLKGPRINNKAVLDNVVDNVHLYNMFCMLLNIVPASNNGSKQFAEQVLKQSK